MYNRYIGNTGRRFRVDDSPAAENAKNTEYAAGQETGAKAGAARAESFSDRSAATGRGPLSALLPQGTDMGDLLLLVLLLLLYNESGDEEFLLILAAVFLIH